MTIAQSTASADPVTAVQPLLDIRKSAIDPNFWYPLARTKDLKRGKTLAVSFAGEPIVLVRPKAGLPFALEDRCAHRQVPLHVGRVDDQSIKCGYHGWTYDKDGNCTSVPYLDMCTLKPNCVRSYPCREAYGERSGV
jgi:phenylpropionate dioxygenase-like ring-hydroxylating dioxygenase large terminal subunit